MPNLLLLLLCIAHGHLQRIALASGGSALLKVLHDLVVPCLQCGRELALGCTLVGHFYRVVRLFRRVESKLCLTPRHGFLDQLGCDRNTVRTKIKEASLE